MIQHLMIDATMIMMGVALLVEYARAAAEAPGRPWVRLGLLAAGSCCLALALIGGVQVSVINVLELKGLIE